MNCYIALLRGINVGGHKKILMTDLKAIFTGLGFSKVTTYIQSGNVVFHTSEDNTKLADTIHQAIEKKYSWQVPVLVKSADEIASILEQCPFSEEKQQETYYILLKTAPDATLLKSIQELSTPDEEFYITENCIYIYYKGGAGKAKMGNVFFENKLKVQATARNYRTLNKVLTIALEKDL